jgi:hypothetical protein
MVVCWSAALQFVAMQQEMSVMKELWLQTQATSR